MMTINAENGNGDGNLLYQNQTSSLTSLTIKSPLSSSSSSYANNNHGKETIHSGQFMVSHFEAEAQDDDDTEVKMPDPDDPNYTKPDDLISCTEIRFYVPLANKLDQHGDSIITSHLEIETSLTKLFKCMNLAYRQKLTSPKWNHFKGVRLRWKDKIRLNNLIWRCWHMQFILKKRTPVCQFASPLDVDVHSNPQSVVLEGKYWKRQLSVIKAEYNKWRRNSKTKAIGYFNDSKSEFDFLEWSPLSNDRSLMITDDWTSDTLFSAINVPFPFPDPREIARNAGIADFIQPSLGPLQPNLDDIDITFQELLQSTRLPPVPEEGADDILKSVDYNFPAIMGTEQLNSANIIDVTNSTQEQQQSLMTPNIEDATMVDLNTTINALQQYNTGKMCSESMEIQSNSTNILGASSRDLSQQTLDMLGYSDVMNETTTQAPQLNSFQISTSNQLDLQNRSISPSPQMNSIGKNILKGRISKSFNRTFRKREPHNYDKAQPTLHQTNIYQQMLAEQQKQQIQSQLQQHQQQQQCQLPMVSNIQYTNQQIQFPSNTSTSDIFPIQSTNNTLNLPMLNPAIKSYSVPQTLQNSSQMNQKSLSTSSEILSILNSDNSTMQDLYKVTTATSNNVQNVTTPNIVGYKNFASMHNIKKISSPLSMGYLSVGGSKSNSTFLIDQHQQQQQQQDIPAKEMFRSNSLPLNSSLQKEEMFVVPKFQAKNNRSRTRSSSSHPTTSSFSVPPLQTATSEPLLNNSTLAQLLTTNSSNKSVKSNPSSMNQNTLKLPFAGPSGLTYQQQQQQPPQQLLITHQLSISPTRSTSFPQPTTLHSPPIATKMMSFPPCLSPDSYIDESPLSPSKTGGNLANLKYIKDSQRRVGHIHAEQKRRYNIKNGFDMLHSLIPQLQQNPNAKLSKAAMLQKGAEYIKQLRIDRNNINEKMEALKKERDNLNISLSHLHSILPANGAPVSRQRTERVKQLYNQYVRYRTMQNWKFWILGLILEPLLNSYTTTVSMASVEELYRTALLWVDQHCSLVDLRPAVSNKLRYLSMTTDILSDPPSTLQEEVLKAVNNSDGQHPNLNST